MKLHTKLNGICAAIALTAASAASATPFYLDAGVDYHPAGGDKVCPTCTSVKDEFQYKYRSSTVITDADFNGIDAGDLVKTDIGLGVGGGLAFNRITDFSPSQVFGANSNNGYGVDYVISFNATGLSGFVSSVVAGVPLLSYGPGLLELFVTTDGVTFSNFMDLKISGGGANGVGTVLFGKVDFTSVDPSFNNLFHTAGTTTCGGLTGYKDIWDTCGPLSLTPLAITFEASQDTNVLASSFSFAGFDGLGRPMLAVTSDHDGSGTFNIPEPSALLLMGAAMLGFGASKRRAKQG